MMDQNSAPLADALERDIRRSYVPFDVPGHKGQLPFLTDYYGARCIDADKNSREDLDYLCQPTGCIREAEMLAAEAFGADHAWFMVGGTTASVQAMVMSACAPGDKVLVPRNAHISVINAVILAGAIPVYLHPEVHPQLGIALGIRTDTLRDCIASNTDAKAVVVNNPTYYGVCSDLKEIIRIAHEHGILVLADEAHGTHFYFGDGLPPAAMRCGADMAAVSMHKTGCSLTQSSILLSSSAMDPEHVREIINLTRSTSASYLLLSSLDLARRFMAVEGRAALARSLELAEQARSRINRMDGYYAFAEEISASDAVFAFDRTKLSVNTARLGLAGIEVFELLRDRYGIHLEFGDMSNILAICSAADRQDFTDALVSALEEIARRDRRDTPIPFIYEYIKPIIRMSPRKAFFAHKKKVPILQAEGLVCSNAVMCYPPGIPLLAPGERITRQIIEHIRYASEKGCSVSGLSEDGCILAVD